ncbi:MAG: Uma2 family endonuclease [Hyphomicrobium sp.]|nr:Uma2 family endonuclease [Hyphomicrobium sp.]
MNVPLKPMTADEFIAWAMTQERGRYELLDGMVVSDMNSERSIHAVVKLNAAFALRLALKAAALPGQAFGDGMAVRITSRIVHEPDAILRLGSPLPDEQVYVSDPVIVVDVLSPGSGPVDTGAKLLNYFTLPSLMHCLVIDPGKRTVLHYRRGTDGQPALTVRDEGVLALHPPGLAIMVADLFQSSWSAVKLVKSRDLN